MVAAGAPFSLFSLTRLVGGGFTGGGAGLADSDAFAAHREQFGTAQRLGAFGVSADRREAFSLAGGAARRGAC